MTQPVRRDIDVIPDQSSTRNPLSSDKPDRPAQNACPYGRPLRPLALAYGRRLAGGGSARPRARYGFRRVRARVAPGGFRN
jgi:hypothetical protein